MVSVLSYEKFRPDSAATPRLLDKGVSDCFPDPKINTGIMGRCGTRVNVRIIFLCRDNLDWLAKSTNWAKFTATASLGVVHKGHETDALMLMERYLPKDGTGREPLPTPIHSICSLPLASSVLTRSQIRLSFSVETSPWN